MVAFFLISRTVGDKQRNSESMVVKILHIANAYYTSKTTDGNEPIVMANDNK